MNDVGLSNYPATLEEVLACFAEERRAVDHLIRHRLASEVALVNQVSEYIIAGGGKRLRPLVHLLAARACGYTGQDHIQLAAVIEFIHTATLLHDDVVDESSRRRGRETAHRIWGNAASVLVGDFLYSRSFQMMVEIGIDRIMAILADTTNRIAEGEVLQLMQLGNPQTDRDGYFEVISSKTACLFSAAGRLGAVLTGRNPGLEQALSDYGLFLGQAFQITDDTLDYQAEQTALGKNLGDDLAEGKVTLPLILAMQRADAEDRAFLERTVSDGGSGELARVQAIMADTGALSSAREIASELATRAESCLDQLDESPARSALVVLARHAVDRGY